MENISFLENLATRLGQSATVKNVYGEPIDAGNKTIIPVAQIIYGFGGGYGHKPKKFSKHDTFEESERSGEGLGAGGGIFARPKGVYEVSAQGTRFIPANYTKQIIVAIVLGFLIKSFMAKKRKAIR